MKGKVQRWFELTRQKTGQVKEAEDTTRQDNHLKPAKGPDYTPLPRSLSSQ